MSSENSIDAAPRDTKFLGDLRRILRLAGLFDHFRLDAWRSASVIAAQCRLVLVSRHTLQLPFCSSVTRATLIAAQANIFAISNEGAVPPAMSPT